MRPCGVDALRGTDFGQQRLLDQRVREAVLTGALRLADHRGGQRGLQQLRRRTGAAVREPREQLFTELPADDRGGAQQLVAFPRERVQAAADGRAHARRDAQTPDSSVPSCAISATTSWREKALPSVSR